MSLRCIIPFLLLLAVAGSAAAEPVPPLPDDNLISNAWFRSETLPSQAGLDGWSDPQGLWGTSQKPSNPTPDGVNGTAARLAFGSADVGDPDGQDAYLRTVVAADPALRTLKFQTWVVSLYLEQATATVAGGNSPQGPWTEVWQPWSSTTSSGGIWGRTPLAEVQIPGGFPYYRIELHGRYQAGRNQGVKYTGVYFSASAGGSPPSPQPPAPPADLQGSALSASEVRLTWTDASADETAFRVQRSDDQGASFQNLANLPAGSESHQDSGLAADSEYRYRVRAENAGGASSWAGPVSVRTLPEGGEEEGRVVVFSPTADAYVNAARPTSNFGSDTVLRARANEIVSFLAFEIDAGTVESAVLRLTSNSFTQIATDVAVTTPLDAAWEEGDVTWNVRPGIGAVIGTLPATPPAQAVELDVTAAAAAAAAAGGRFSLVLLGTGTGQSFFLSREAALDNPQLAVTYPSGGEPPPPPPEEEPVPHLEVGPSPALLLEVGDTVQLQAAWFDADGIPAPLPPGALLRWTSSDPERVSVDAGGFATALQDDGFALLMVAAEGAEKHMPGVASVAVGAVLHPGLLQLDPSLVQEVAVDQDPEVATGYLAVTVDRVAATEALGAGDVVTFGSEAAIAVESVETLPDRLVLRGAVPPFEAVYEELDLDLDATALDRVAGVYADAGFPPLDGTPFTLEPGGEGSEGGSAFGSSSGAFSTVAAPAEDPCRFTLNAELNPDAQIKLEVKNDELKQLAIILSGLVNLGMPEVRTRTQLKCVLDFKAPVASVPVFGVVTFNVWARFEPGFDFSVDFGHATESGEIGGPTFNISSSYEGGLDWNEVDGLRFPAEIGGPDLTGSAIKPYLDGLAAAPMNFGTSVFLEAGFKMSLYAGAVPFNLLGDELSLVDFDVVIHRFSLRSDAVLPAQTLLGPQDPLYLPPAFTDSWIWDFFPLKSIKSGALTQRIVDLFGGNFLGGPFLELSPINVFTSSHTSAPPELVFTANPVWIGGSVPYSPSTLISALGEEDFLDLVFRPRLGTEVWVRRPGDPEFFEIPGTPPEFLPLPGDEGEWEVRAFDRRLPWVPFPLASPIETLSVRKAPPVLITPVDPELVVTLGEVGTLDLLAVNPTTSEQTYTLSNEDGPSWLSVEPADSVTLAPGGGIAGHLLTVDCTGGEAVPSSWIDLDLAVVGDETEYAYRVFAGCENFSIDPDVIVLKGSVASPPVPLEGELTIRNRTDGELPWFSTVGDGVPVSLEPISGFIPAGGDQVVTVASSCTVGGETEYPFALTTVGETRELAVVLECSDTGGNTWGDPHLVTHDGVKYDFQAQGEMVLSRQQGGSFEVQVRQAGSGGGRVSTNKAAAMRVAGDRVAFYLNPPAGGGRVMVDGAAVVVEEGGTYVLPAGGAISLADSVYTVTWPGSGSYVRVRFGSSYLNVRVHPDAVLAGSLEGLLGNYDGDGADDFRLRDGTPLPSPPSFAGLYDCSAGRCFAYDDPAGWIIRDAAESLFDYDLGVGPLDYAPQDGGMYPLVETSLDDFDPALVAWAQSRCVAAGITDPVLLDACILDIVVSGDVEMGLGAGEIESGTAPEPGVEVCDGFDNDRDGAIDDGDVCACIPGTAGGSGYLFCSTLVEWAVARTACLAQGLDLARIQTAAENQAVNAWIVANAFQARWIGLTDEGQEATWIWADGSPAAFFNWGDRQPSGETGENCVEHVHVDASWNDLPCNARRGFICE